MSDLKKSTIEINVLTNENNLPEVINWAAKEAGVTDASAEAMILSFWDKNAGTD